VPVVHGCQQWSLKVFQHNKCLSSFSKTGSSYNAKNVTKLPTCMCAYMSRQFVRTCESFTTADPLAQKRTFTCLQQYSNKVFFHHSNHLQKKIWIIRPKFQSSSSINIQSDISNCKAQIIINDSSYILSSKRKLWKRHIVITYNIYKHTNPICCKWQNITINVDHRWLSHVRLWQSIITHGLECLLFSSYKYLSVTHNKPRISILTEDEHTETQYIRDDVGNNGSMKQL